MPRASEEMKRIAALLETEVLAWRGVTVRPMFGMTGLYRDRSIFAALPRTRAMDSPDSIAFRFPKLSARMISQLREDKRIVAPAPDARWISFLVHSEEDIHDALNWLATAYREAGKKH
jgi:Luciferase